MVFPEELVYYDGLFGASLHERHVGCKKGSCVDRNIIWLLIITGHFLAWLVMAIMTNAVTGALVVLAIGLIEVAVWQREKVIGTVVATIVRVRKQLALWQSRQRSKSDAQRSRVPAVPSAKRMTKTEQPLLGLTDAVCPYCETRLQKKPVRKKKCPACGNVIFVRTRPQDKARILVREDQLLAVEEQWSIVNGTHQQFLANQRRRQTTAKNYEATHARAENPSDRVSEQLTRELTYGLSQGMSPREVARNISERVEGFEGEEGKKRAASLPRWTH